MELESVLPGIMSQSRRQQCGQLGQFAFPKTGCLGMGMIRCRAYLKDHDVLGRGKLVEGTGFE